MKAVELPAGSRDSAVTSWAEVDLSGEGDEQTFSSYLRRELWEDVLGCLAIAVVLTLLIAPFTNGPVARWLPALVLNSIVSLCIGLTVSNAFRWALPPLRRRFSGAPANVALTILIGLTSTAVGVEIAVRIVEAIGGMRAETLRPNVLRIGLVVVAIVLAIEVTYERLRQRARRDEMRVEQARKAALRAQLKALQARTNPHFLFNSLNTVAGLIEDDPGGAERMLERLGELFRYALEGADREWVRLARELAAVEGYLEVESVRFGDRLRVHRAIADGAGDVLVPPLVLQPLVENAILHAVAPRKEGGSVRITADVTQTSLTLTVEDDGDGPGSSQHSGSGSSLAELEQRLALIYTDAATFETGPATGDGTGFRARLTLPLEAPG